MGTSGEPPLDRLADEDDELEGCEDDPAAWMVDDRELPFVALSPAGDARRIEAYGAVFGAGQGGD